MDYYNMHLLGCSKIDVLPNKDKILELIGLNEENSENIRIIDQYANFVLLHYVLLNDSTKHIKGIIIDTVKEKIICRSFCQTQDVEFQSQEVKDFLEKGDVIATNAFEGTIIRVFWNEYDNLWFISTHRRINGRNSRWAGRAFGVIFDEIFGYDYSMLDKSMTYVFLMSCEDNKIVCRVDKNVIRLVDAYKNDERIYPLPTIGHPSILYPMYLDIKTFEDLCKNISSLDWRTTTGIFLLDKQNNNTLKVNSPKYMFYRDIRGNEPSLRFRYLQLRNFPTEKQILIDLFPIESDIFRKTEEEIFHLVYILTQLYIDRYISKHFNFLDQKIHLFLVFVRNNFDINLKVSDNISKHISEIQNTSELNELLKKIKLINI